jgi:hypothetical protein
MDNWGEIRQLINILFCGYIGICNAETWSELINILLRLNNRRFIYMNYAQKTFSTVIINLTFCVLWFFAIGVYNKL